MVEFPTWIADGKGGKYSSLLYGSYGHMKRRCYDKKDISFPRYGGRGIVVCVRWLNSFPNFCKDVGPHPGKEMSLDRIDVNGNYEPGNVRWATHEEQCQNTRSTRLTPDLVRLIRSMYHPVNMGHVRIARALSLPIGAVAGVVQNKSWRNVT
jgi:hypothetical protein